MHPMEIGIGCNKPQFNGDTSVMFGPWCLESLIERKLTFRDLFL